MDWCDIIKRVTDRLDNEGLVSYSPKALGFF